jgi:hypothetical protein
MHKLEGEETMDKMIIGLFIGATTMALITCGGTKCLKRTKKIVANKIENILKG